jgi:hypothetical protein
MADPSETTQVSREPASENAEKLLGAVRALASQVEGLQSELQALRQEARGLPAGNGERPGWDEAHHPVVRESPTWVRSVDSPGSRGLAVPWLLLEILFLVAVAVLAAVAGLDALAIAGVMAAAWLLVAVAEWTAARNSLRERVLVFGASAPQSGIPDDPSWFAATREDTALEVATDARTATRLPPPQPE